MTTLLTTQFIRNPAPPGEDTRAVAHSPWEEQTSQTGVPSATNGVGDRQLARYSTSSAEKFDRSKLMRRARASAQAAPTPSAAYYIDGLEKWLGVITAVYARDFSARLSRILGPTTDELEAEFENRLVGHGDADLLKPGADFYLTVRTVLNERNEPLRTASIVMRRPGRWTAEDLTTIRERTAALAERLSDAFP